MQIERQPLFHDRQFVTDMSDQTVTVAEGFKDVAGSEIITKDLGEPASYTGWVSVLLASSANNSSAQFQLLIDGNPAGISFEIPLRVKNVYVGFTLMSVLSDILAGQSLSLQFASGLGTLTLIEYTIMIDGIPQGRVVE